MLPLIDACVQLVPMARLYLVLDLLLKDGEREVIAILGFIIVDALLPNMTLTNELFLIRNSTIVLLKYANLLLVLLFFERKGFYSLIIESFHICYIEKSSEALRFFKFSLTYLGIQFRWNDTPAGSIIRHCTKCGGSSLRYRSCCGATSLATLSSAYCTPTH